MSPQYCVVASSQIAHLSVTSSVAVLSEVLVSVLASVLVSVDVSVDETEVSVLPQPASIDVTIAPARQMLKNFFFIVSSCILIVSRVPSPDVSYHNFWGTLHT